MTARTFLAWDVFALACALIAIVPATAAVGTVAAMVALSVARPAQRGRHHTRKATR